ncbi:MAG: serine protease [Cyanobacteriota bacterium]|jgi:hypothetical protein
MSFTAWLRHLALSAALLLVNPQTVLAAPGFVHQVINQAEPGTGFFLRVGPGLFFVTARHVLGDSAEPIQIKFQDGKALTIPPSRQLLLKDVDLAVIPVSSDEAGEAMAMPADRPPAPGDALTVWGYPVSSSSTASALQSRPGQYLGSPSAPKDGYELLYSSKTQVGFSGGPILDGEGLVTGVHGRADGYVDGAGIQHRTGRALGIPISVLLSRLSASSSAQPQKIDLAGLRQEAAIVSLRRAVEILGNASMSDQVLVELSRAEEGHLPKYCTELAKAYYYTFYSSLPDLARARNALSQTPDSRNTPAIYYGFASHVYKMSGNYAQSLAYNRLAEKTGGQTILLLSERQLKQSVLDLLNQCLDTSK